MAFRSVFIVLGFMLLAGLSAGKAGAAEFSFIVFGDTQDTSPAGRDRVERLVEMIRAERPRFAVHIGDIKGGGACSDDLFQENRALLERIDRPVVYLPGDNEWTDCYQDSYGGSDPIERLHALRRVLFEPGESLGRRTIELEQQWDPVKGHASRSYIENARWMAKSVMFATFHVVGSNNNLRQDRAAIEEHMARDAATVRWLHQTFDRAEAANSPAAVIFFHANPAWGQNWWNPTGFDRFREALLERAARFGKPVLAVHGDTHTFRIDKPVRGPDNAPHPLTRLEVFGPPDVGAIEVTVDTDTQAVFSFRPFTVALKDQ